MSTVSDPAGVGSLGVTHPELMTSFRRAQWRMLLAAMFCYLFFYTGRQTFGFAIPGIQAEFGVSKAALGWASAGKVRDVISRDLADLKPRSGCGGLEDQLSRNPEHVREDGGARRRERRAEHRHHEQ